MSPLARALLFVSLLSAASWAFAAPREQDADAKPAEPAKSDAKPADTPERPASGSDASTGTPEAPPANTSAATPARDAAKPARPAGKQRPAWPPPPELIS